MAFRTKAQRTEDPGIGSSFDRTLDRLMSTDGSFRVRRAGAVGGFARPSFIW